MTINGASASWMRGTCQLRATVRPKRCVPQMGPNTSSMPALSQMVRAWTTCQDKRKSECEPIQCTERTAASLGVSDDHGRHTSWDLVFTRCQEHGRWKTSRFQGAARRVQVQPKNLAKVLLCELTALRARDDAGRQSEFPFCCAWCHLECDPEGVWMDVGDLKACM